VSTAGQTWKRLEAEGYHPPSSFSLIETCDMPYDSFVGFIALQTSETDSIGFLESRGISSRKSKGKKKARPKNIKRAKYSPVPEAMTSKKFQDYFQPAKEGSLLGMVCNVWNIYVQY
jgi:hypothetical protein